MKKITLSRSVMSLSILTALAACGGGGGGGDSSGPAPTQRALTGVAAKGLISQGIVNVYAVSAAGVKSAAPIDTRRTDANGVYSLNLGASTGAFTIEVSGDSATTFADEFSGLRYALPASLVLRSLVSVDASTSTAVNSSVTPFSDMIVTAALSAGGLSTANIAAARTGVIKLLGFDPLNVKAVNANFDSSATASADEKQQALVLAALSQLVSDVSNTFGCPTGISEKIVCVLVNTTGSVKIANGVLSISPAAQQAISKALEIVIASPLINKTGVTTSAGFPLVTTPSVTVPPVADNSALASVKALFGSLRTNLNALTSDATAAALELRTDAFAADFRAAVLPIDGDLVDLVGIVDAGAKLLIDDIANRGADRAGNNIYPNSYGSCGLMSDLNGVTPVSGSNAALNVACVLTTRNVPNSEISLGNGSFTAKRFTKSIVLTPEGGTEAFSYFTRARMHTVTYTKDAGGNRVNMTEVPGTRVSIGAADVVRGALTRTTSGSNVVTASIVGDMPARVDDKGMALDQKQVWNVRFVRSDLSTTTYRYDLTGTMQSVVNGAGTTSVSLKPGSGAIVAKNTVESAQNANAGVASTTLVVSAASGASTIDGTLSVSDAKYDASGTDFVPTKTSFTGSFGNAGSSIFNGTVMAALPTYASYNARQPDSAANYPKSDISFSGTLAVPGRPMLKLSAVASTTFDRTTFSGNYDDASNFVLVNGDTVSRALAISSATGVSVVYVDGAQSTDVVKDSAKYATINRSGIITYNDGSFESLK